VTLNGACGICNAHPGWRIERQGDAVISWACNNHLAAECDRLQRDYEVSRLVVLHYAKMAEVADINRMLREIAP
jgi:hypothetical protein